MRVGCAKEYLVAVLSPPTLAMFVLARLSIAAARAGVPCRVLVFGLRVRSAGCRIEG